MTKKIVITVLNTARENGSAFLGTEGITVDAARDVDKINKWLFQAGDDCFLYLTEEKEWIIINRATHY